MPLQLWGAAKARGTVEMVGGLGNDPLGLPNQLFNDLTNLVQKPGQRARRPDDPPRPNEPLPGAPTLEEPVTVLPKEGRLLTMTQGAALAAALALESSHKRDQLIRDVLQKLGQARTPMNEAVIGALAGYGQSLSASTVSTVKRSLLTGGVKEPTQVEAAVVLMLNGIAINPKRVQAVESLIKGAPLPESLNDLASQLSKVQAFLTDVRQEIALAAHQGQPAGELSVDDLIDQQLTEDAITQTIRGRQEADAEGLDKALDTADANTQAVMNHLDQVDEHNAQALEHALADKAAERTGQTAPPSSPAAAPQRQAAEAAEAGTLQAEAASPPATSSTAPAAESDPQVEGAATPLASGPSAPNQGEAEALPTGAAPSPAATPSAAATPSPGAAAPVTPGVAAPHSAGKSPALPDSPDQDAAVVETAQAPADAASVGTPDEATVAAKPEQVTPPQGGPVPMQGKAVAPDGVSQAAPAPGSDEVAGPTPPGAGLAAPADTPAADVSDSESVPVATGERPSAAPAGPGLVAGERADVAGSLPGSAKPPAASAGSLPMEGQVPAIDVPDATAQPLPERDGQTKAAPPPAGGEGTPAARTSHGDQPMAAPGVTIGGPSDLPAGSQTAAADSPATALPHSEGAAPQQQGPIVDDAQAPTVPPVTGAPIDGQGTTGPVSVPGNAQAAAPISGMPQTPHGGGIPPQAVPAQAVPGAPAAAATGDVAMPQGVEAAGPMPGTPQAGQPAPTVHHSQSAEGDPTKPAPPSPVASDGDDGASPRAEGVPAAPSSAAAPAAGGQAPMAPQGEARPGISDISRAPTQQAGQFTGDMLGGSEVAENVEPGQVPTPSGTSAPAMGEGPIASSAQTPQLGQSPPTVGQPPVSGQAAPVAGGLPPVMGQAPSVPGSVPPTVGQASTSQGGMPSTMGQVPTLPGDVPPAMGEVFPTPGQSAPSPGHTAPSTGQAVPQAGMTPLPMADGNTPAAETPVMPGMAPLPGSPEGNPAAPSLPDHPHGAAGPATPHATMPGGGPAAPGEASPPDGIQPAMVGQQPAGQLAAAPSQAQPSPGPVPSLPDAEAAISGPAPVAGQPSAAAPVPGSATPEAGTVAASELSEPGVVSASVPPVAGDAPQAPPAIPGFTPPAPPTGVQPEHVAEMVQPGVTVQTPTPAIPGDAKAPAIPGQPAALAADDAVELPGDRAVPPPAGPDLPQAGGSGPGSTVQASADTPLPAVDKFGNPLPVMPPPGTTPIPGPMPRATASMPPEPTIPDTTADIPAADSAAPAPHAALAMPGFVPTSPQAATDAAALPTMGPEPGAMPFAQPTGAMPVPAGLGDGAAEPTAPFGAPVQTGAMPNVPAAPASQPGTVTPEVTGSVPADVVPPAGVPHPQPEGAGPHVATPATGQPAQAVPTQAATLQSPTPHGQVVDPGFQTMGTTPSGTNDEPQQGSVGSAPHDASGMAPQQPAFMGQMPSAPPFVSAAEAPQQGSASGTVPSGSPAVPGGPDAPDMPPGIAKAAGQADVPAQGSIAQSHPAGQAPVTPADSPTGVGSPQSASSPLSPWAGSDAETPQSPSAASPSTGGAVPEQHAGGPAAVVMPGPTIAAPAGPDIAVDADGRPIPQGGDGPTAQSPVMAGGNEVAVPTGQQPPLRPTMAMPGMPESDFPSDGTTVAFQAPMGAPALGSQPTAGPMGGDQTSQAVPQGGDEQPTIASHADMPHRRSDAPSERHPGVEPAADTPARGDATLAAPVIPPGMPGSAQPPGAAPLPPGELPQTPAGMAPDPSALPGAVMPTADENPLPGSGGMPGSPGPSAAGAAPIGQATGFGTPAAPPVAPPRPEGYVPPTDRTAKDLMNFADLFAMKGPAVRPSAADAMTAEEAMAAMPNLADILIRPAKAPDAGPQPAVDGDAEAEFDPDATTVAGQRSVTASGAAGAMRSARTLGDGSTPEMGSGMAGAPEPDWSLAKAPEDDDGSPSGQHRQGPGGQSQSDATGAVVPTDRPDEAAQSSGAMPLQQGQWPVADGSLEPSEGEGLPDPDGATLAQAEHAPPTGVAPATMSPAGIEQPGAPIPDATGGEKTPDATGVETTPAGPGHALAGPGVTIGPAGQPVIHPEAAMPGASTLPPNMSPDMAEPLLAGRPPVAGAMDAPPEGLLPDQPTGQVPQPVRMDQPETPDAPVAGTVLPSPRATDDHPLGAPLAAAPQAPDGAETPLMGQVAPPLSGQAPTPMQAAGVPPIDRADSDRPQANVADSSAPQGLAGMPSAQPAPSTGSSPMPFMPQVPGQPPTVMPPAGLQPNQPQVAGIDPSLVPPAEGDAPSQATGSAPAAGSPGPVSVAGGGTATPTAYVTPYGEEQVVSFKPMSGGVPRAARQQERSISMQAMQMIANIEQAQQQWAAAPPKPGESLFDDLGPLPPRPATSWKERQAMRAEAKAQAASGMTAAGAAAAMMAPATTVPGDADATVAGTPREQAAASEMLPPAGSPPRQQGQPGMSHHRTDAGMPGTPTPGWPMSGVPQMISRTVTIAPPEQATGRKWSGEVHLLPKPPMRPEATGAQSRPAGAEAPAAGNVVADNAADVAGWADARDLAAEPQSSAPTPKGTVAGSTSKTSTPPQAGGAAPIDESLGEPDVAVAEMHDAVDSAAPTQRRSQPEANADAVDDGSDENLVIGAEPETDPQPGSVPKTTSDGQGVEPAQVLPDDDGPRPRTTTAGQPSAPVPTDTDQPVATADTPEKPKARSSFLGSSLTQALRSGQTAASTDANADAVAETATPGFTMRMPGLTGPTPAPPAAKATPSEPADTDPNDPMAKLKSKLGGGSGLGNMMNTSSLMGGFVAGSSPKPSGGSFFNMVSQPSLPPTGVNPPADGDAEASDIQEPVPETGAGVTAEPGRAGTGAVGRQATPTRPEDAPASRANQRDGDGLEPVEAVDLTEDAAADDGTGAPAIGRTVAAGARPSAMPGGRTGLADAAADGSMPATDEPGDDETLPDEAAIGDDGPDDATTLAGRRQGAPAGTVATEWAARPAATDGAGPEADGLPETDSFADGEALDLDPDAEALDPAAPGVARRTGQAQGRADGAGATSASSAMGGVSSTDEASEADMPTDGDLVEAGVADAAAVEGDDASLTAGRYRQPTLLRNKERMDAAIARIPVETPPSATRPPVASGDPRRSGLTGGMAPPTTMDSMDLPPGIPIPGAAMEVPGLIPDLHAPIRSLLSAQADESASNEAMMRMAQMMEAEELVEGMGPIEADPGNLTTTGTIVAGEIGATVTPQNRPAAGQRHQNAQVAAILSGTALPTGFVATRSGAVAQTPSVPPPVAAAPRQLMPTIGRNPGLVQAQGEPQAERPRTPVTREMLAAMPPTLRPALAAVTLADLGAYGRWDQSRLTDQRPLDQRPLAPSLAQMPEEATMSYVQLGAGRMPELPEEAVDGRIVMPQPAPQPQKPLVDRAAELATLVKAAAESAVVSSGDEIPAHVARMRSLMGKVENDLAKLDDDLTKVLPRLAKRPGPNEEDDGFWDWLFGAEEEMSDDERQVKREKAWEKAADLRENLQTLNHSVKENRSQLFARETLAQANQALCVPLTLPGQPPIQAELLVHPDGEDKNKGGSGRHPTRIQLAIQTHHLGSVGISLEALGERLSVGLQVSTPAMKALFEKLVGDLKEQLGNTGYQLDPIGVQVAAHEIMTSLLLPAKRTKWGTEAIGGIR